MAEEQLYQQMYQLGDVLNEATDSFDYPLLAMNPMKNVYRKRLLCSSLVVVMSYNHLVIYSFGIHQGILWDGLIHEGHVQLLHAAGISSLTLLITHMRENDGVDGLASATLNIIVEEAYRIRDLRTAEKNLQTTASNIGKTDQRLSLNKNKKRIEELTTALALRPDTAANVGQRAHWTREK
ncbi:hypothetical protein F2Q69_00030504 [Brassica cretica]|nr:hypothetical protein F2Q69_00030504 [Brassica cretica]